VTTGPQDQGTAAASGHVQLRASQADREDVVDALKAAFVAGRLTEDELEARVGQAFTAGTYRDLAAITADIPPGPVAAQPARMPDRVVARGTGVIVTAAALGGALLIGGSALILWAITMTGVLLFTVSVLLNARLSRRALRPLLLRLAQDDQAIGPFGPTPPAGVRAGTVIKLSSVSAETSHAIAPGVSASRRLMWILTTVRWTDRKPGTWAWRGAGGAWPEYRGFPCC
jgi:hypothetical protein